MKKKQQNLMTMHLNQMTNDNEIQASILLSTTVHFPKSLLKMRGVNITIFPYGEYDKFKFQKGYVESMESEEFDVENLAEFVHVKWVGKIFG